MIQKQTSYINVGMTASLTGRYSRQGSQALAGVQAWVEDTNRSGGIWLSEREIRLPLRFIHYDDESRARRCEELIERLMVEDQVTILFGPYSSGLSLRAAVVAQRHRRVLWNHGGASESIYEQGAPWVIGILTPSSRYFHGVLTMIRETYPLSRSVAIVYSTAGAFPREVALGAEQYCRERGFETILTYPYESGTTDFTSILGQLERNQPHLVLGVGRIEDDIRFADQWVHCGMTGRVVGLIATPLTLFREALGSAAEGFLGPSQWEPGIITMPDYGPSSEELMEGLTAQCPTEVDYPMAQAYAGGLIAQRCLEVAGSLDNHALRQAAGQLDFTTFYGRFKIDPITGRQLGHLMPVVQWQQGRKIIVWSPS